MKQFIFCNAVKSLRYREKKSNTKFHEFCMLINYFLSYLLSISNCNGQTAVHLAAAQDRVPLLKSLLCAGGCPLLSNFEGFSAIELASQNASHGALHMMECHLNYPFEEENENTDLRF